MCEPLPPLCCSARACARQGGLHLRRAGPLSRPPFITVRLECAFSRPRPADGSRGEEEAMCGQREGGAWRWVTLAVLAAVQATACLGGRARNAAGPVSAAATAPPRREPAIVAV